MTTIHIPNQFAGEGEVKGFFFSRVDKNKAAYLYKVKDEYCTVHYEVIKRRATPIIVDFEKKILSTEFQKERYPKAKDWGTLGWTFTDYEQAKEKLDSLFEKYKASLKASKDAKSS